MLGKIFVCKVSFEGVYKILKGVRWSVDRCIKFIIVLVKVVGFCSEKVVMVEKFFFFLV